MSEVVSIVVTTLFEELTCLCVPVLNSIYYKGI